MGTVAIGFSLAGTFMYIHVYSTIDKTENHPRESLLFLEQWLANFD